MLEIKEKVKIRRDVFNQLIMAQTHQQFNTIRDEQTKKFIGDEAIKLQAFRNKAEKYCLTQIPETFVGLGIDFTHFSGILDAITRKFPVEEDYKIFIFKFFDFVNSTRIQKYPETPVQQISLPMLKNLENKISEQALSFIINRLIETVDFNLTPFPLESRKFRVNKHIVSTGNSHLVQPPLDI